MSRGVEEFFGQMLEAASLVGVDGSVGVVDLGRDGQPQTWIKLIEDHLCILGEDGEWYEIDVDYAKIFWQAMEIRERYLKGIVG